MTTVEELKQQIQDLSREELGELRTWLWQQAWPLDAERLKAEDRLTAYHAGELKAVDANEWRQTLQRRYRELVDGKVKGVPGPLVFQRLREKLGR